MSIFNRIQPAFAVPALLLFGITFISFSASAAEAGGVTVNEPSADATGDTLTAGPGEAPNAVTPQPEPDPSVTNDEAPGILTPEWVHEPTPHTETISRSPILTKRFESAASPTVEPAGRMGWFGIGVRVGTTQLRLTPPSKVIAQVNASSGQAPISGDEMSLRANLLNVTPTLHLGGSGYFFKFDFPIAHSQSFDTVGLGIYPINLGWYIDAADLFPYLSLGGTASAIVGVDSSGSRKIIGGVAQLRASLGVKYFPARSVGVSAELGYSKWAVGAMSGNGGSPGGGAVTASDTGVAVSARGGLGSVVDLSMGVEWL